MRSCEATAIVTERTRATGTYGAEPIATASLLCVFDLLGSGKDLWDVYLRWYSNRIGFCPRGPHLAAALEVIRSGLVFEVDAMQSSGLIGFE